MGNQQMQTLIGVGILVAAISICAVTVKYFGAGNAIEDAALSIVKDELPSLETAANAELATEAPEAVPLADAVEDELNTEVNKLAVPVAPAAQ
jgi:hypothetical protein